MKSSRRDFLHCVAAGGAAYAASGAWANSAGKTAERPNIVFLFSDDHSVPDLGCYGNEAIRTPNLDALAAAGMRFDRAYVACPQCSPSRASILTGRSPHAVGASRLHVNAHADTPSVPQLLGAAGYFTGAVGKVHQGHIHKHFDFRAGWKGGVERFFDKRPSDSPFFLWVGSTDPHRDYAPGAIENPHDPNALTVPAFLPDTPEVRRDLALYYDEIGRFDSDCGRVLALLDQHGLAENTLVVMAGDNGMPFPRAKATLYEPGIRVPLLARWPGHITPGRSSAGLVSLMDLAATWLSAAGLPIPQDMEAQSLTPLLHGEKAAIHPHIFSERNWHDNWDPMRCVVSSRYKLIQNYRPATGYLPSLDLLRSPSFKAIKKLAQENALSPPLTWYQNKTKPQVELYDLKTDPGEWQNLAHAPAHQQTRNELEDTLGAWMNATHDFLPPPSRVSKDTRADTLDGSARWWEE